MQHFVKARLPDSGFDNKRVTNPRLSIHYGEHVVEDHLVEPAARRMRKANKDKAKEGASRITIGEIETTDMRGTGWSVKVLIDQHACRIKSAWRRNWN